MTGPVFVDTNVFLYAADRGNPSKQQAALAWREELWKDRLGRTSFQVLQEYYANFSYKWPASREAARAEIRDLLFWRPAPVNAAILEQGWKIQDRFGFSFWDALIISAAKALTCRYLLTEDLQANQDLDGLIVINPFLTDPSFLSTQ